MLETRLEKEDSIDSGIGSSDKQDSGRNDYCTHINIDLFDFTVVGEQYRFPDIPFQVLIQ